MAELNYGYGLLIPHENAENMAHTRQVVSRIQNGRDRWKSLMDPSDGLVEEEVEQAANIGAKDITTLAKEFKNRET
ncbi:MAG: hypothetical protein ACLUR5_17305 [Eubacterium ventriosum]